MVKVEFSVLSYYPSYLTDESINLGVLFHNIDEDTRVFAPIKNSWHRVQAFDDEANIDFIKLFLQGIQSDIESNFFNGLHFNMKDYIRFYVNEYKFSQIKTLSVDDFNEFIETTNKVYLKYDFTKTKRLNATQELAYLKTLLKSYDIDYSRKEVTGTYEDRVKYDYVINDYGLKFFHLTNENIKLMPNKAKVWAFNAAELKKSHKTIIIYVINDIEDENKRYVEMIRNILNDKVYKIMTFDEFITFMPSIKQVV